MNPWYLSDFCYCKVYESPIPEMRCHWKIPQSLILVQAFITNTSQGKYETRPRRWLLGTSRSSLSSKCQTSLQGQALRSIKTSTHRPKTANKMEGFNSLTCLYQTFWTFSHNYLAVSISSRLCAVKGSLELREFLELLEGWYSAPEQKLKPDRSISKNPKINGSNQHFLTCHGHHFRQLWLQQFCR